MSETRDDPDTLSVAFISGPIQPPQGYFDLYYVPMLTKAISSGHSFVVGPAPGMDTESLHYLIAAAVKPEKITVYLARFQEKLLADDIQWFVNLGGNIEVEGGTTEERDAAMTRDSDYDILRYMTIEEQKELYGNMYYPRISQTEKNERRRKGLPLHVNHGFADSNLQSPSTATQSSKAENGLGQSSINRRTRIKKVVDKLFSRS